MDDIPAQDVLPCMQCVMEMAVDVNHVCDLLEEGKETERSSYKCFSCSVENVDCRPVPDRCLASAALLCLIAENLNRGFVPDALKRVFEEALSLQHNTLISQYAKDRDVNSKDDILNITNSKSVLDAVVMLTRQTRRLVDDVADLKAAVYYKMDDEEPLPISFSRKRHQHVSSAVTPTKPKTGPSEKLGDDGDNVIFKTPSIVRRPRYGSRVFMSGE